jgi:hypothetical protein
MAYGLDYDNRPTCLNYGCNQPVANGGSRWRPFCWRCHKNCHDVSVELKEGVTPFKTGKCSNADGHLGFNCPMDYDKAPWAIGLTQVDHVNGNLYDNTPENCSELCETCHKNKGRISGDFRKQHKTRIGPLDLAQS